jgi:N-acetylmuramoyl-L-alanine amidase
MFRRHSSKPKHGAAARPHGPEPGKRTEPAKFAPDSPAVTEVVPSSNYDDRKPDLIVLHSIGSATSGEGLSILCAPQTPRVSAHYFVTEDGRVIQLVPETMRAWHAGPSAWGGCNDINSRSIGIEASVINKILDNADFPETQIDAVINLCLTSPRVISFGPSVSSRIPTSHRPASRTRVKDFPGASFTSAASGIGSSRRRSARNASSCRATREAQSPRCKRISDGMDTAFGPRADTTC